LIGEQQDLAGAVAAAFPVELASLQIDAAENRAVEAVEGVFVPDEVVEERLERFLDPRRLGLPFFSPSRLTSSRIVPPSGVNETSSCEGLIGWG
jgi:hypothetical protein